MADECPCVVQKRRDRWGLSLGEGPRPLACGKRLGHRRLRKSDRQPKMHGIIGLLALLVLCGCNSAPNSPVDAAIVKAALSQPITCQAGPDCDAKWSRASAWIAENSAYKIKTANDSIVQTEGPLEDDDRTAFTATKAANAAGEYEISLTGGCDNVFRCAPSIDKARLSFAVSVRDSTPAPVVHEGARIGAVFIPVAPGSAAALQIESDRGLIVADVVADGSAAKAGILKGDVLLSVDGSPVNSLADLTTAVNAAARHHKAEFEMSRDGSMRHVSVPF